MHCLSVLSNCMEDTSALDEIRNSGGLEKLVTTVTEPNASVLVQATTAKALGRAARNGL